MIDVLAVDLDEEPPLFKPEERYVDQSGVLAICLSLVTYFPNSMCSLGFESESDGLSSFPIEFEIDDPSGTNSTPASGVLKLAHYSVKEYLLSERIKTTSACRFHTEPSYTHGSIAQTCLAYLRHPNIMYDTEKEDFPRHALGDYAAKYWQHHYLAVSKDRDKARWDDLACLAMESDTKAYRQWLQDQNISTDDSIYAWYYCSTSRHEDLQESDLPTPLACLSHCGATKAIRLLLETKTDQGITYDLNDSSGIIRTPLQAAAVQGHKTTARLLLEWGADVNASDNMGIGTLHLVLRCVPKDPEEMVQLLLGWGADASATLFDGENPISLIETAMNMGNEAVVRLLPEHGASPNK